MATKNFEGKYYYCYSPAMRAYLVSQGLGFGEEDKTLWKKEQQIKFLQDKNIQYNEEDIKDLERRRWKYDVSDQLSECLTVWTNNRPSRSR